MLRKLKSAASHGSANPPASPTKSHSDHSSSRESSVTPTTTPHHQSRVQAAVAAINGTSTTSSSKSSNITYSHMVPPPSPSKIPMPTTPTHRDRERAERLDRSAASKENSYAGSVPPSPTSERGNYLSFLWAQNQAGAPTTPVKVNKVAQPPAPGVPMPAYTQSSANRALQNGVTALPAPSAQAAYERAYYESDDVHMLTMKNTINPNMLKSLAAIPGPAPAQHHTSVMAAPQAQVAHNYHYIQPAQQVPPPPSPLAQTAYKYSDEDIRMQTIKHDAKVEKERKLELWERELLERSDVKRKATVAQIYFLDYYFDLLGYIASRKKRVEIFKADTTARNVKGAEYARELQSYSGRERVLLRKRRTKLRVDQFRIIAQVGQGGYGSVYLARKIDTNEVCALKKMRKGTLAKMDEVKHVLVERDILTAVKTPWLVRLLYAFQDREHVYLAMEYVPGGDFRTLLNNSGVLKEEHAKFYAAEMFAGVNELHKLGYIHRDLKPENFLVDSTGHVKLTDFGLATGSLNPQKIDEMKSKLNQVKDDDLIFRSTMERRTIYRSIRMTEPRYADSVVGSPDYMPPEVLRGKTYTFSADYWSLGCIMFEFLCGYPPFSGSTPEETWANLKNWQRALRRPVYDREEDLVFNLTDMAWDAVTRLIAHPKDRVATLDEVQALPFFAPLPFSHLRDITSPFIPVLDSETDVGYFDSFSSPEDMAKYAEVFKKQRDVEAVEERGSGDRHNWVGFTFGRNANNIIPPQKYLKPQGEPLQTMF